MHPDWNQIDLSCETCGKRRLKWAKSGVKSFKTLSHHVLLMLNCLEMNISFVARHGNNVWQKEGKRIMIIFKHPVFLTPDPKMASLELKSRLDFVLNGLIYFLVFCDVQGILLLYTKVINISKPLYYSSIGHGIFFSFIVKKQ